MTGGALVSGCDCTVREREGKEIGEGERWGRGCRNLSNRQERREGEGIDAEGAWNLMVF